MSYLGSWKIDDNVTFPANTHTTGGVASDADSSPAYRVYEDETGTPILTGTMAFLDSVNTTGFYSEQIVLSAANGFEKGKSYTIYIEATVGGNTGTMNYTLQIEAEVDTNTVSASNVAAPGDQMALVDDAISAGKYDETTAFPVASDDTIGVATRIARTGADGDTLETLSDQIDALDVIPAASAPTPTTARIETPRATIWEVTVSGLGNLTDYTTIDVTLREKDEPDDLDDSNAILKIRLNSSGLSDGLLVINKTSTGILASNGSISIVGALTAGTIQVVLKAVSSRQIADGQYSYDARVFDASGDPRQKVKGTWVVGESVGQSIE